MVATSGKRVLLLIGSPRKKGTSYSFARTMQTLALEAGGTADIEFAYEYYDGKKNLAALRQRIAESDLIGLITPLYYDTLPGVVVWLFEQLEQLGRSDLKGKAFFAVSQCAYPFPTLNEPSFASCRIFAAATGMQWLGGAGYGGGTLIDGALLEQMGGKGEKLTGALRQILSDALARRPVEGPVLEGLTMRVPRILYRPLALAMNFLIWNNARKLGVKDMRRKVYLE